MTGYTAKVGLRKPPINGGYVEGPATPVPTRDPHWLRDQIYRAAAALDGLPPEMRETLAHRTRGRKFQVDPELITDFDEVEVAPGVTVAVERKPCPHCPCTYSTECCYCDGSRTPLEDS